MHRCRAVTSNAVGNPRRPVPSSSPSAAMKSARRWLRRSRPVTARSCRSAAPAGQQLIDIHWCLVMANVRFGGKRTLATPASSVWRIYPITAGLFHPLLAKCLLVERDRAHVVGNGDALISCVKSGKVRGSGGANRNTARKPLIMTTIACSGDESHATDRIGEVGRPDRRGQPLALRADSRGGRVS